MFMRRALPFRMNTFYGEAPWADHRLENNARYQLHSSLNTRLRLFSYLRILGSPQVMEPPLLTQQLDLVLLVAKTPK